MTEKTTTFGIIRLVVFDVELKIAVSREDESNFRERRVCAVYGEPPNLTLQRTARSRCSRLGR